MSSTAEPVRKSTRARRPVGTKPEKPKPLPTQPFHEEPETWESPVPECHQQAIHGHEPSTAPDTKRQTQRGSWVPRKNHETWASTILVSTATTSRPKKKPAAEEAAARGDRQDSAQPLPEHSCGLGETCELSKKRKSSPDSSSSTSKADEEVTDAALALGRLRHAALRTMTRAEMRTDFVEFRRDRLETFRGVFGHRSEEDGRWVEESQVRESLKREAEYREGLEREGKRRRTMGGMLAAFAESGSEEGGR
jgi:hypothetical protein